MTADYMNNILDFIICGTIGGICLGFCALGLIAIWKWFIGVIRSAILYLFPGLKGCRKKDKEDKL